MRIQPPLLSVVLVSILVLSMTTGVVHGQKIDRKHPTVYLTFDRFLKQKKEVDQPDRARFILRNNSKWAIYVAEWIIPVASNEVPVAYVIRLESGGWGGPRHVDVINRRKLLPGKSVMFSIPRNYLIPQSKIYVEFYFSWELDQGQILPRETVHRAYFSTDDLPDGSD